MTVEEFVDLETHRSVTLRLIDEMCDDFGDCRLRLDLKPAQELRCAVLNTPGEIKERSSCLVQVAAEHGSDVSRHVPLRRTLTREPCQRLQRFVTGKRRGSVAGGLLAEPLNNVRDEVLGLGRCLPAN